MDNNGTQNLKDDLQNTLNFLISVENENNMNHLIFLKEKEIIDIESFQKFDYIFSRAKALKNGFEFILFDNASKSPISKCVNASEKLKKYLFNLETIDSKIIIIIDRIFDNLGNIYLNDHKGNLNNFIYARN